MSDRGNPALEAQLERIVSRTAGRRVSSNADLAVAHLTEGWSWGWRHDGQPYFAASTTKLYTATMIYQLVNSGDLTLDTRAGEVLDPEDLTGLAVWNGTDHGRRITIRHLLAHTTGIADYFEDSSPGSPPLVRQLLRADREWSFTEALDLSRRIGARFPLGAPGKAHYSDANYQLLGRIVEVLDETSFATAFRSRIAIPYELEDTYVFTHSTRDRYREISPITYRGRPLDLDGAFASFGPDGGLVTTIDDGLKFLSALWRGEVLTPSNLRTMTGEWNKIFAPFFSGVGIERYVGYPSFLLGGNLPKALRTPPLYCYAGVTGTLLAYAPDLNVVLAATTNQLTSRSLTFRLVDQVTTAIAHASEGTRIG